MLILVEDDAEAIASSCFVAGRFTARGGAGWEQPGAFNGAERRPNGVQLLVSSRRDLWILAFPLVTALWTVR
jgi:hypothetical protein